MVERQKYLPKSILILLLVFLVLLLSSIGDFMKDLGVKVILEDNSVGIIVRRLNAESYEILRENNELVILSPKEFKEVVEK